MERHRQGRLTGGPPPDLSVIVVVYNMGREAARTLYSLSEAYQRDIDPAEYEVIVVDNGSDTALPAEMVRAHGANFRLIRIDDASRSPAKALNRGLAEARGRVIGTMIDGARIVTPGLLHFARAGAGVHQRAVVATLGWYLGHDHQGASVQRGYDRVREDALLESIEWPADGYRLFEIATMDESSVDGWLQPISESNALFLRRELWDALGGVDERFASPGGGLINLDTFARALELPHSQLVILLGEATFHQVHGGISTNATAERRAANWAAWVQEYAAIRGRPYAVPRTRDITYLGTLPPPVLVRFVRSAIQPARRNFAPPLGDDFDQQLWTRRAIAPAGDERIAAVVSLARQEFHEGRLEASCALARLVNERAPNEPALDRMLSLVASSIPPDGPHGTHRIDYHSAMGDAHRMLGETEPARAHYRAALALERNVPRAHVGLAALRMPGEDYLVWLERLYRHFQPDVLLEIGVYQGLSLALARPPTVAVGVDPKPKLMHTLQAETHIFSLSSDRFFAERRYAAQFGSRRVSIGFIDGLHCYEQALKDFIGLEALCDHRSAIFMHDTVPLDESTQSRMQETAFYTGDVWKTVLCLRHYRPDLNIFTIAAQPTGLTVITGLDPNSTILSEGYADAVGRFAGLPFGASEDALREALELVPNDWSVVRSRLEGRAAV